MSYIPTQASTSASASAPRIQTDALRFADTFADYGITDIDPRGAAQQYTTCPRCSPYRKPENREKRCLSVNVRRGFWLCHNNGCGFTGHLRLAAEKTSNAIGKNYAKKNTPQPAQNQEIALEASSVRYNASKPQNHSEIWVEPEKCNTEDLRGVFQWFSARGISESVVTRNRISVVGGAIAFPFFRDGVVVNVKYRSLREKKFWQSAGGEKIFFGLQHLNTGVDTAEDGSAASSTEPTVEPINECIITEGELDALSFHEAEMWNAVSVPDGAPTPESSGFERKFSFLDNCESVLRGMRRIFLACDADAAGEKLRDELARRLGAHRCWVVRFPEGCKDANEVLQRYGAVRLWQCVEKAVPMPVEGVVTVRDYEPALDDLYEKGFPAPPKSGFQELDTVFHPFPGALTIVTGVPSHGKTTFLQNYLIGLAKHSNWRFAVYSPESPAELWGYQACEIYAGKPFLPNYNGRMTASEYDEAKSFIADHVVQLHDDEALYSVERVIEAVLWAREARGIDAAIIDPWNKLAHARVSRETEHDYIGRILPLLQLTARRCGVHLFVVAHPTKCQRANDGHNYEIPTMYNISGSSNWFNMPDNGLIVYRYRHTRNGELTGKSTTHIYIGKAKTEIYGRDGASVKMSYDAGSHTFYEARTGSDDNSSASRGNNNSAVSDAGFSDDNENVF